MKLKGVLKFILADVKELLIWFKIFGCFISGQSSYPAVINSEKEANFIKQAQKGFTDNKSYWIGGSTSADSFSTIGLGNYTGGDTGNSFMN